MKLRYIIYDIMGRQRTWRSGARRSRAAWGPGNMNNNMNNIITTTTTTTTNTTTTTTTTTTTNNNNHWVRGAREVLVLLAVADADGPALDRGIIIIIY